MFLILGLVIWCWPVSFWRSFGSSGAKVYIATPKFPRDNFQKQGKISFSVAFPGMTGEFVQRGRQIEDVSSAP
ncbi:hypothetical protein [Sulfitobacter sediminis]